MGYGIQSVVASYPANTIYIPVSACAVGGQCNDIGQYQTPLFLEPTPIKTQEAPPPKDNFLTKALKFIGLFGGILLTSSYITGCVKSKGKNILNPMETTKLGYNTLFNSNNRWRDYVSWDLIGDLAIGLTSVV